jgi:FkbM family methyltransferase
MLNRALISYARLPEHPMKYRVVRWLGRWAFPSQGVVQDVEHGIRMHLHPRDWIEYEILRGNPHEPKTIEFLSRNLRPGDNALLTGVNNGMHVIAAAKAVGAGGRVIGVEPQPAALLRARANIDLNGVAGSVLLVAAAVGHVEDLTPMSWSSEENTGAASLLDSGPGFVVPLLQLSTVIEKLCPGGLHLMLLDVQGYEVPALKGLARSPLPDLLIVEDGAEWLEKAGSSRKDLYHQVRAMGYELRDLRGTVVTPEGPALLEENLVGVRPGASVNWLPASAATRRDHIPEKDRSVR